MKNTLFSFALIGTPTDKTAKEVSKYFNRAGQNVIAIGADGKVKRTAGVTYKEVLYTVASGQTVLVKVKQTGDVWQVAVNGKTLPIKNQDDTAKAVGEIAKFLGGNEAKFQAALAKQRVALPKGIKTAAPKMEVVLQTESDSLDKDIAAAREKVAELKAELGA